MRELDASSAADFYRIPRIVLPLIGSRQRLLFAYLSPGRHWRPARHVVVEMAQPLKFEPSSKRPAGVGLRGEPWFGRFSFAKSLLSRQFPLPRYPARVAVACAHRLSKEKLATTSPRSPPSLCTSPHGGASSSSSKPPRHRTTHPPLCCRRFFLKRAVPRLPSLPGRLEVPGENQATLESRGAVWRGRGAGARGHEEKEEGEAGQEKKATCRALPRMGVRGATLRPRGRLLWRAW